MAKKVTNSIVAYNDLSKSLAQGDLKPVYLFDGDETFYIDELIQFFEDKILSPEEKDFNLITLYGKDVDWADVVNAARRFPMFAEKQVVILKEAAQLKGITELAGYLDKPMETTILVIDHRHKKALGTTKWVKAAQKVGAYVTFEKLKDYEMPKWLQTEAGKRGFVLGETESQMLVTFLGNDLQVIINELGKIKLNLPNVEKITVDLIEKYIGISRDYNTFDLPEVLFSKDQKRLARMMEYFVKNPKSAPIPAVVSAFYMLLTGVYKCYFKPADRGDYAAGIWDKHRTIAQLYKQDTIANCLILLEQFAEKGVGIGTIADSSNILKEMIGKYQTIIS